MLRKSLVNELRYVASIDSDVHNRFYLYTYFIFLIFTNIVCSFVCPTFVTNRIVDKINLGNYIISTGTIDGTILFLIENRWRCCIFRARYYIFQGFE